MKKRRILLYLTSFLALLLETLPYGVILRFANPEGEPWIRRYSYFSLTPFGYANFGPLLTAVGTVITVVLLLLLLRFENQWIYRALLVASLCSFLFSLAPLAYGTYYFNGVSFAVSVTLALAAILSYIEKKRRR